MMPRHATEDLDDDDGLFVYLIPILFNLRRLQAESKTMEQLVRDFLFVDDAALLGYSELVVQRIISSFVEAPNCLDCR